MEFVNLGKSGLKVSRIILGGMSLGTKKWQPWVLEEDEALQLLKYAYDKGIRTFDTADIYSNGESEVIIGKFLKKYNINRSTVVILSKCWSPVNEGFKEDPQDPIAWINRAGLSRKHILDAIDDTVRRLGTYVDVYQIHRFDANVPKEEIMEALHDVVKSGKARYIGASSMRTHQFVQLQAVAEKHGWTKFISMQGLYNLVYREEERDMIPFCKETGVGLIPWSPIARGMLARPWSETGATLRAQTDFASYLKLGYQTSDKDIIGRVEELASKKKVSMAQLAIAWSLHKGVNPIIGFNKPERIDEAIDALKIELSDEEITYLEEPYLPHPLLTVFDGERKTIVNKVNK